jgi:hypothetical protein
MIVLAVIGLGGLLAAARLPRSRAPARHESPAQGDSVAPHA